MAGTVRLFTKLRLHKYGRGVTTDTAVCDGMVSDFDKQHKTPVCKKQLFIPKAHYGGRHTVTMLPGSGIGPECMCYVKEIFSYIGAPVDFEEVNIDMSKEDDDDLNYAITSIKRNGVAIKGNIETKSEKPHVTSRNVALRNELDMYAYVLDCRTYPGVGSRHKDVDIVVVRQNTEGEYSMLEHSPVPGVVEAMKVITTKNSERVAKFAFEYARKHCREKVTTVHKANIMKIADGHFLRTAQRVAKQYPDIKHEDMIVDNTCMQLVSRPTQFDVMLLPNLYGSIIANVICGLVGGAGLLSGRNYGDRYAVFEPGTRNTGTGLVGKNVANPTAMINASVDMLRHLGHHYHADLIHCAVQKTINQDKVLTRDIGGDTSTGCFVKAIICNIEEAVKK